MSANSGDTHPSTYECVDQNAEKIASSSSRDNGGWMNFVSPQCQSDAGTITCPPYYSDRQLTCVVCSKWCSLLLQLLLPLKIKNKIPFNDNIVS